MGKTLITIIFVALFGAIHLTSAKLGGQFSNMSPFVAMFFCASVFRSNTKILLPLSVLAWVVVMPIAAYTQGSSPSFDSIFIPLTALCIVALIGIKFREKSILAILTGSLLCCILFHLTTNLYCFFTSASYTKNLLGLSQAIWTTPTGATLPTAFFFKNLCISTLFFTATFLLAIKLPAINQPLLNRSPEKANN